MEKNNFTGEKPGRHLLHQLTESHQFGTNGNHAIW